MAYGIPQETIDRVRSQTDIVQVISEYLTLKKAGSNFRALCPFHKEKTPSFNVNPAKQIFHCFGCGVGGNVFSFLMRHEGFAFPEAVRFLAERVGIEIKQEQIAPGQGEIRERLLELYEYARRFYHQCLLKSPKAEGARKYLEQRQLSEKAIETFSLGYAPKEWDSFLSAARRKGFKPDLLLEGGLAKKSAEGRVYDAFRNRVMFPIWGLSAKVIAFGGRTLGDDKAKYINSPETAIYHKGNILYNLNRAKKEISNKDSVIVVEGYTDAIRLVLGGIENVVASSGTAFTQAQARLLKRYAGEVVLVFDSDSAGVQAAGRGIEVLLGQDLAVRVAVLPSGQDPDEFVLENGAEAFRGVVEESRNFIEFHVESALAGKSGAEVEQRIKTANTLALLVGKIPDPIRREEYLRLVASKLDMKPEVLAKASQKGASGDKIEEGVTHFERRLRREEKEYLLLVRMLIERPERIGRVREHLDAGSIQSEALRELFEVVFRCEGEGIEESALLGEIRSEEAQQMLSKLMFDKIGPELLYPVEWWIGFIKSRRKEKALKELSLEIAQAEKSGDVGGLEGFLRRKAEANRELVEIKRDMMKVSVDSSVESTIGG
jgi:DNA primase